MSISEVIEFANEGDKQCFEEKLATARDIAHEKGKDWLCHHGEPCLCWEEPT